jgi:hypothetical protein
MQPFEHRMPIPADLRRSPLNIRMPHINPPPLLVWDGGRNSTPFSRLPAFLRTTYPPRFQVIGRKYLANPDHARLPGNSPFLRCVLQTKTFGELPN